MIRGIELTEIEFVSLEKKITKRLRKCKGFTSPTYQKNGLVTINKKLMLLEPKKAVYKEEIEDMKLPFESFQLSTLKKEQI